MPRVCCKRLITSKQPTLCERSAHGCRVFSYFLVCSTKLLSVARSSEVNMCPASVTLFQKLHTSHPQVFVFTRNMRQPSQTEKSRLQTGRCEHTQAALKPYTAPLNTMRGLLSVGLSCATAKYSTPSNLRCGSLRQCLHSVSLYVGVLSFFPLPRRRRFVFLCLFLQRVSPNVRLFPVVMRANMLGPCYLCGLSR